MCVVLCRFYMNTTPDVYAVVHVLYEYSPWCVWCCAGSIWIQFLMCVWCCADPIWIQPLMWLVLRRFYAGHHQGQDAHRQLYDEGQFAKLRISYWLCILSYITPENTDLPSGSMFSQSSLIRVEKSELCRLSSVTHRGRTGSHRFSTLDTAHAWFTMVSYGGETDHKELRWCPGIRRRCFSDPVRPYY